MKHLQVELQKIEANSLLRRTEPWSDVGGVICLSKGERLLNFSSNDYLNLATNPYVKRRSKQAIDRWGCSAAASRLMSGTLELHEELESKLAALLETETALVFSSGFGMNVGLVSALAGRSDVIFADRLIHASLVDGARLSSASIKRFAHNDAAALENLLQCTPCSGRRLVITESVFSMDGDMAPLAILGDICAKYDATLLVDEAHAVGIRTQGAGLCRATQMTHKPDFIVGTLGKALASLGGFVGCSDAGRSFFVNRVRSFIYATALPPACLGAALGALELIEKTPDLGEQLLERSQAFHQMLASAGMRLSPLESQIIPIHVGDNAASLELARRLRNHGIVATAIRPPTVRQGTARLRLSITLAHTLKDLERAAGCIADEARGVGLMQ